MIAVEWKNGKRVVTMDKKDRKKMTREDVVDELIKCAIDKTINQDKALIHIDLYYMFYGGFEGYNFKDNVDLAKMYFGTFKESVEVID